MFMHKKKLHFYSLLIIAIIIADRITKSWALGLLQEKILNPYLSFGLTFNRGINWGLFNSTNTALFIGINTAIAAVIVAMGIYTFSCWKNHLPIIGHILILAGAVSNYFDRIFYGGVIDFIVLSAGNWSWPAFNIADAAILLGIGLVIITNYKNL